jgi:hypothetical protein
VLLAGCIAYITRYRRAIGRISGSDSRETSSQARTSQRQSSNSSSDWIRGQQKPRGIERSRSRSSARRHRGSNSILHTPLIEILLLFVLISINAVAKLTLVWEQGEAITGLISWLYLVMIACLRPVAGRREAKLTCRLRGCSVLVYVVQWLVSALNLRSVLLATGHNIGDTLRFVRFATTSALVLLMISTKCSGCPRPDRVLGREDAKAVSPEAYASILSAGTFSWLDGLLWKGNAKLLELEDIWALLPQDKAAIVLEDFRATAKGTRLVWRLISHFKGKMAVQMCWALVTSILNFAPPLLIKGILGFLEKPASGSRSLAWLCVVGLAVSSILSAFAGGQAAWTGRRNGVHMRTIMVTGMAVAINC